MFIRQHRNCGQLDVSLNNPKKYLAVLLIQLPLNIIQKSDLLLSKYNLKAVIIQNNKKIMKILITTDLKKIIYLIEREIQ